MNPAAARALGYEAYSAPGRNLVDFLAPSARKHFPDYLRRVLERGQDSGSMLVVARDRTKHVWLYRRILLHQAQMGRSPSRVRTSASVFWSSLSVDWSWYSALFCSVISMACPTT